MGLADTPAVDEALAAVRALMRGAGAPFLVIGGCAVHHHGYRRFTQDVDVLVPSASVEAIDGALSQHGFVRDSPTRLRHVATGVRVDVLPSGLPLARRPDLSFPDPRTLPASPDDGEVVGLVPLLRLKLLAGRRQDIADIVALLKPLDDSAYLHIEAAIPATLRAELAAFREEALEELRFDELY